MNINTDDVLEILAEYGNPKASMTRNRDSASPVQDPEGVNWTVEVTLHGFNNPSYGRVCIYSNSSVSAREAASRTLDSLYEFIQGPKYKETREEYLRQFSTQALLWLKKPEHGYRGDFGPKMKPRFERVKNDPCPEPTELLDRLANSPEV